MRRDYYKYYVKMQQSKNGISPDSNESQLTKRDAIMLMYQMKKNEQTLEKISRNSSFWSGVAQNITGDAIFEIFLRGASKLFKL